MNFHPISRGRTSRLSGPSGSVGRGLRYAASLLFIGAGLSLQSAHATRLHEVEVSESDAGLRFQIEFDEAVKYRAYDLLVERGFFYADFYGVDVPLKNKEWKIGKSGVLLARSFYYPKFKVARFVIYSSERMNTDISMEAAAGDRTFSIYSRAITFRRIDDPSPPVRQKKVVLLDPGHGGKNHGSATSKSIRGKKYLEKDVALQICLRMIRHFRKSPNLELRMSRVDDTFVSLDDRIRMIDAVRADMLMSVHMNGTNSRGKKATGFEVYHLAEGRELNSSGRAVIASAQGTKRARRDQRGEVDKILKNLSSEEINKQRVQSRELSFIIEKLFSSQGPMRGQSRGVKSAGFRVLTNINAPSTLVECGFLDNPADAKKLVDPEGQEQMAALLFNAINMYFARVDPTFVPHLAPVR